MSYSNLGRRHYTRLILMFRLTELNIVTTAFFQNFFYMLIFNNYVLFIIDITSNLGECNAVTAMYNFKKY